MTTCLLYPSIACETHLSAPMAGLISVHVNIHAGVPVIVNVDAYMYVHVHIRRIYKRVHIGIYLCTYTYYYT